MLKNVNYAILKCQECQKVIKVGSGEVVEKIECDCGKTKEAPKKKATPKKEAKVEKSKNESEDKKGFMGGIFSGKD